MNKTTRSGLCGFATPRRRGVGTAIHAVLGGAALLLAMPAAAEPAFARLYKNQYGYPPSCNACHKDGGGTPVNGYGEAYKTAGLGTSGLVAIEGQDSDGDGATNGAEIRARANPGSARSTPDAPGDWLDLSKLIPRPVREAYPEVRSYKPLDAILTEREFARARAMGVTLAAADENTIYVPVADGRAIGMAIIVPAVHEKRQFFLLVTADRQLKVSAVAPVESAGLPEAARAPALYGRFAGQGAADLPAGGSDSLAAAVAAAVKKAMVVMHVRLKKD